MVSCGSLVGFGEGMDRAVVPQKRMTTPSWAAICLDRLVLEVPAGGRPGGWIPDSTGGAGGRRCVRGVSRAGSACEA